MFNITPTGLRALQMTQTCASSSRLCKLVPKSESLATLNIGGDFSLIIELGTKGWTFERGTPSKKMKPYRPGDQKIWYYHLQNRKGGINSRYLGVLAKSDELFNGGLKEIFHWQQKGYYTALLAVPHEQLNSVLPWQPRAFYQLLLQRLKTRKNRRVTDTPLSGVDRDDAGPYARVWGMKTHVP